MKIIGETQRLRFREFTEDDFDLLFSLDTDPDVMRYISEGIPRTKEEVHSTLDRIVSAYAKYKHFGIWATELRDSDEFIGWVSLKPLHDSDEIEVGYRLLKKNWGNGYATEGAQAMIERGFNVAKLNRVVAIIDPRNEASRNVLKKVGMRFERIADYKNPIDCSAKKVELFAILNLT